MRRHRSAHRAAWMGVHGLWVAALVIGVVVGRRYSATELAEFGGIGGQCDNAFSNGDNGPFGYDQNARAAGWINWLLVTGAVASIGLAVWSWRLRLGHVAAVNMMIGFAGAVISGVSVAVQSDANPYCRPDGWHGVALVAAVLIVVAAVANLPWNQRRRGGEPTH